MARKITMTQFDAKAQELGDVGKALAWAKANGYELDTGTELPPVEQPQGALSAAAPEQTPAVGGGPEDEEYEDSLATMAENDTGDFDFTKLNDPKVFSQMYQQQRTAAAQQEQSAKQLFEQARARLAQRYAGPDRGDQMFALSRAMLSPRKVPGFKGFAGNVFGTFADISTAERQAAQQREDQLIALKQQYQQGNIARQGAQQKGLLDLMKTYAAVNKPVTQRTGFNPVTGELQDMDTGLPVTPPPPKVGEVRRGYRFVGGDPANSKSWQKVM